MSRAPQYQPGQIVPGTVYRVHRVIGAGGMGTVYDVEDTTVGKRYVLKTLHANLADRDDLAARLLREARALARMHHPSIVEVFTAGTTTDQLRLPYFVMERLNGQSLRQVLARKGRLELDQALDIGIDLLDALDHAHELGMIHRDVKPDNIYLHKGVDGTHVAKLLDFGIAKVMASQTQHTGGRFIGTFRYASPEQILGKEVSPQADLYAAGLTLYEMIAGRGPFDDIAGEIEIGKAHASLVPPRISRFVAVPAMLDDLIASSLDKDPAKRPKDAYAFASVLRELKQSLRGGARPNDPASQQITAKPVVTSAPTAIVPEPPQRQAITPRQDGPVSDKPTRLESPQAREAPTAAPTNPYGPPVLDAPRPLSTATVRIAHTMQDGAPPPMTMIPMLSPQPPAVDRSAETNVPSPESLAPRNDTVIIAPSAPPPAPVQAPAFLPRAEGAPPQLQPTVEANGVSTFAAHTTETPARRAPIAVGAAIFVLVALVGVVGLALLRSKKEPAAPVVIVNSAATVVATAPATTSATPPVETPVAATTSAALAPPPATSAPRVHPATTAPRSSKPQPTTAPAPTTKKDPLHVGSGLD